MSYRDQHPEPEIVDTVCRRKARDWKESSQRTAKLDAPKVLEALVAEYGVDASVRALSAQGFDGDAYRYLITPLHDEAVTRRQRAEMAARSARKAGS